MKTLLAILLTGSLYSYAQMEAYNSSGGGVGNGGNFRTKEFSTPVSNIMSRLNIILKNKILRDLIQDYYNIELLQKVLQTYNTNLGTIEISFGCKKLTDPKTNEPVTCQNDPIKKSIECNENNWINDYSSVNSYQERVELTLHEVLGALGLEKSGNFLITNAIIEVISHDFPFKYSAVKRTLNKKVYDKESAAVSKRYKIRDLLKKENGASFLQSLRDASIENKNLVCEKRIVEKKFLAGRWECDAYPGHDRFMDFNYDSSSKEWKNKTTYSARGNSGPTITHHIIFPVDNKDNEGNIISGKAIATNNQGYPEVSDDAVILEFITEDRIQLTYRDIRYVRKGSEIKHIEFQGKISRTCVRTY